MSRTKYPLMFDELKELRSLKAKAKRHNIPIKRSGLYGVQFSDGCSAHLGSGTGTSMMDARIRIKKRRFTRVR